jgi:hypothetical protein
MKLTKVMLLAMAVMVLALPVCADWGQTESPVFTLDTTVPEPLVLAVAILPLFLLLRRH